LGTLSFSSLLPASICDDARIRAAAETLDGLLRRTAASIPNLLLFARLDPRNSRAVSPLARLIEAAGGLTPLNTELLEHLAWQFHVDFRDAAATQEQLMSMVLHSIPWHRIKGTPRAVSEGLRSIGYADARILEGGGVVRHDGEILHDAAATYAAGNRWAIFDVEVDLGDDMGISVASVAQLRQVVEVCKNARSHLRALRWKASMTDVSPISDSAEATVRATYADARQWGFPLHNGTICYNNGIFRARDGKLSHDGAAVHSSWAPDGHAHNARLDVVTAAVRKSVADAVRYEPRHDAVLFYDGGGRRGLQDSPAVDKTDARLDARLEDAVNVADTDMVSLVAAVRDNAAQFHDGSLSHGQRYIHIKNGLVFHDGVRVRGQYGGRELCALRRDGLAAHDGMAMHRLWGWLPGSSNAALFTYRTLADTCGASVLSAADDVFGLHDTLTAGVFRYALHNALTAHDGMGRYSAKEV
jgi:P2-related tail formation protein